MDAFQVPTFGVSCYITALESDYGTPPNSCSKTTIKGKVYSGTVTNPPNLTWTFCSSFIANVKLQGSATLNSGQDIQYNVKTGAINDVANITGHDGTPVVAGKTVARDTTIIPGKGVLVDIHAIGTGLLANDTGQAIKGYRLDLYNGPGKAACSAFVNSIRISACQTPQAKCPGSSLQ